MRQRLAHQHIRPRLRIARQARANLFGRERLEHPVARQQNRVALGQRIRLRVAIDLVQILAADVAGQRFALRMRLRVLPRHGPARDRRIQHVCENMRTIQHPVFTRRS
jgi:hypothetical protein